MLLKDVPGEAMDIVVRAPERAIRPHDDAADGANATRRVIDFINDRERPLFVRNRQVAAGKSERRKRAKRGLQTFGRNGERDIGAGELVLLEKVIVEGR